MPWKDSELLNEGMRCEAGYRAIDWLVVCWIVGPPASDI